MRVAIVIASLALLALAVAAPQTFWWITHNLIAHPLLLTGAQWADRFHDWTTDHMRKESP